MGGNLQHPYSLGCRPLRLIRRDRRKPIYIIDVEVLTLQLTGERSPEGR
jgi:hypothetical protein